MFRALWIQNFCEIAQVPNTKLVDPCASYIFVFKLFRPQFKIPEVFIDEIGRPVEHLRAFRPTVQSICAMWLASAGDAPPHPIDLAAASRTRVPARHGWPRRLACVPALRWNPLDVASSFTPPAIADPSPHTVATAHSPQSPAELSTELTQTHAQASSILIKPCQPVSHPFEPRQ